MSDTISRQAAIDAVYKCSDIFAGDMPVMVVKADAYEALAQLPSADVAPVRHGRWITTYRYGFPIWECSECGTQTGTANFPYCFNCGAKMDEEVEA